MEILLKSDSSINKSQKEIEVADIDFEDNSPEEITLDALQSKFIFAKVTVNVKVHKASDPEMVRTGKQKQEVSIADQTGSAKVTLWEEQVGSLTEGISYKLESFIVKEWGGIKHLSFGGESKITSIDDIEFVKICNTDKKITDVAIMAVAQLECYKACLRCNARIETVDDTNGRCSKADCRMLQRIEFCTGHVNAQLMMLADGKFLTLAIFDKLLYDMLQVTSDSEVTEEAFLSLPKLDEVIYNEKNIITKFSI